MILHAMHLILIAAVAVIEAVCDVSSGSKRLACHAAYDPRSLRGILSCDPQFRRTNIPIPEGRRMQKGSKVMMHGDDRTLGKVLHSEGSVVRDSGGVLIWHAAVAAIPFVVYMPLGIRASVCAMDILTGC
jgi:hypothetical protein